MKSHFIWYCLLYTVICFYSIYINIHCNSYPHQFWVTFQSISFSQPQNSTLKRTLWTLASAVWRCLVWPWGRPPWNRSSSGRVCSNTASPSANNRCKPTNQTRPKNRVSVSAASSKILDSCKMIFDLKLSWTVLLLLKFLSSIMDLDSSRQCVCDRWMTRYVCDFVSWTYAHQLILLNLFVSFCEV